MVKTNKSVYF